MCQIPIPFLIAIEQARHHDDDRLEHFLQLGVVGVETPLSATIESDFYEWPRIKALHTTGGLDLPERIQNLLIFKSFEVIHPALDGTNIADLPIEDATPWIETQFLTAEAEIVLAELRRHVMPDLNFSINNCTAFVRVPIPFKQGKKHVGPVRRGWGSGQ